MHIVNKLYNVRKDLSRLKAIEKRLKMQIHEIMDDYDIDEINSGEAVCERVVQTVRRVHKEDVPVDVWDYYSRDKDVSLLILRKL